MVARFASISLFFVCIFFAYLGFSRANYFQLFCMLAISLALLFLMFWTFKKNHEQSEFEQWLISNKEKVLYHGALYKSQLIKSDTLITEYMFVASFVLMTTRSPSGKYIAGSKKSMIVCVAAILTTLLFGIWGIPHGIIWSVKAIVNNISGGHKMTVGEYYQSFCKPAD